MKGQQLIIHIGDGRFCSWTCKHLEISIVLHSKGREAFYINCNSFDGHSLFIFEYVGV